MSLANNAHTRLYLLRNRTEVRRMPIRLWWFGQELRVVRAAPSYQRLLGCRVDRIGNLPVLEAKAKVAPLFAGSASWKTYMSNYTLTSPEILHGTEVAPASAKVSYRLSMRRARRTAVTPLPLAKSSKPLEVGGITGLAGAANDWKQALAVRNIAPPQHLQHPKSNYWFADTPAGGIFYLQYNHAADAADKTLEAFAKRAQEAITARRPRAVIVDLRYNTGGNGNLTPKLVEAVNRGAPLSALSDRRPGDIFRRDSRGRPMAAVPTCDIVGEPVGDGLEFWAEGGNIIMPYSGLYAHFANGAHSLSPAPCPTADYCNNLSIESLAPDIAAAPDRRSYLAGKDPATDAIERDLAKRGRP